MSNAEVNELFQLLGNTGYRFWRVGSVWYWRRGNKQGEARSFDVLMLGILADVEQSTVQSLEKEFLHVVAKYRAY